MARYSKQTPVSEETKQEALQLAKANQKLGQTKEQTKLIAQGIQRGIEQYKKQQKAKKRDLDRQRKGVDKLKQRLEASSDMDEQGADVVDVEPTTTLFCCKLPWLLLLCSWLGFMLYVFW